MRLLQVLQPVERGCGDGELGVVELRLAQAGLDGRDGALGLRGQDADVQLARRVVRGLHGAQAAPGQVAGQGFLGRGFEVLVAVRAVDRLQRVLHDDPVLLLVGERRVAVLGALFGEGVEQPLRDLLGDVLGGLGLGLVADGAVVDDELAQFLALVLRVPGFAEGQGAVFVAAVRADNCHVVVLL